MSRSLSCDAAAVALSAALDGELGADEQCRLAEHLEQCERCRSRQSSLQAVTRRARLHVAPETPDLSAAVVGAAARVSRERAPWSPARAGLVVAGVAQLLLSLPLVWAAGTDGGHLSREAGVTEVAIAIGMLAAAWRPWRAAGMLPLLGVLAIGLAGLSVVDVIRGEVAARDEVVHLLPLAGALLLWQMRHRGPIAPPPAVRTSGWRESA